MKKWMRYAVVATALTVRRQKEVLSRMSISGVGPEG